MNEDIKGRDHSLSGRLERLYKIELLLEKDKDG